MTKDTIMQLIGHDPADTIEKIRAISVRRASLKATVQYGDELRKIILAKCSEQVRLEFVEREEKISEARIENLALIHKDYADFLQKKRKASEEFDIVESEFHLERSRFEYLMQLIALEKARIFYEGRSGNEGV